MRMTLCAPAALMVLAMGCTAYTAPNLTTPVAVSADDAARLTILVQSVLGQSGFVPDPTVTAATNEIAAALRRAGFRVSMDPKAPHNAAVTVKGAHLSIEVAVDAKGVIVDKFFGNSDTKWQAEELAALARHVRQRLERSEALASLAAELASKPQAGRADQPRPWVKTTGASAATRRLAVLEFRGSLAPNLLALLSDQARSAAVEAVRPHGIAVMTRENTAVMLKDQGRTAAACTEGDCEVETARLIGAHLVVTGEVSRIGSAQFLQMKLFDAEAGTLLASKQADATDDLALVKAAKPAAAALFE